MNKKKQNPGTWLKVAIIVIVVVLILGILMVITRPSERPAKPENNQSVKPDMRGEGYKVQVWHDNITINTELPFEEGQEYVYKQDSEYANTTSSFTVAGIREINGSKYYAIMADAWGEIYFEPDGVWETFEKNEHPRESIFYNIETGEVCERNPPIGGNRLINCGFVEDNTGPLSPWMLALHDNMSLGIRVLKTSDGKVLANDSVAYRVVGREAFKGRECFKVVFGASTFWVDAETRIMLKWTVLKDESGAIGSEEILIKAPFPLTE